MIVSRIDAAHVAGRTPSIHSRHVGALVGLAAGDALGTTLEFRERGSFTPITDMVGGGPFGLQPGQWTDDTSMALCLAESLVECHGHDAADQMRRYVRWRREGYWSSTGRCFDIGIATRRALADYEETGDPVQGPADPEAAGNGSLMRLAPVAIRHSDDARSAVRSAAATSLLTHGAREATDACRWFASLLVGALQGVPKHELLAPGWAPVPGLWQGEPLAPKIASIAAGSYHTADENSLPATGYVVHTLEATLWAFATTDSFEAGALRVANLGGDADSTGAVYGQIAGAYYGLEGIPAKWLEKLALREEIASLAERLAHSDGILSLERRDQARRQADELLGLMNGDLDAALARLRVALDEMGFGGSMAGRAVTERMIELLERRRDPGAEGRLP